MVFVWYTFGVYFITMVTKNTKKSSWLNRLFGRSVSDDDFEDFDEISDEVFDEMDGEFDDDMGDDIFDDGSRSLTPEKGGGAEDLQINLVDKGDVLVAQALVPGLEDNEIDIDLNREMLTITTNSNEHCIESGGDYLYEELVFGSFARSILLPAEIEVEESKAEAKDGVLTIEMPKIDKAARKKLSIKKR